MGRGVGKDGEYANVTFGALVSHRQLPHRLSIVVPPISHQLLMTGKELMAELERRVSSFLALHRRMKVMYNTRSQRPLSAALRTHGWWGQTSAQIPRQSAFHSLSAFYWKKFLTTRVDVRIAASFTTLWNLDLLDPEIHQQHKLRLLLVDIVPCGPSVAVFFSHFGLNFINPLF